jgi:hypothetical protein
MSTRNWTIALSAVALIAASLPSLAQMEQNVPEIAALPDVPLNMDNTDSGRLPSGPAPDYRLLWADPAIKNFVGPSENGWDFTQPDSIPGFGSLPYLDSTR